MVARVNTVACQGIDVLDVDVQVQTTSGLPVFTKAGLPSVFCSVRTPMSAFGGKADIIQGVAECPLIAISGHSSCQTGKEVNPF